MLVLVHATQSGFSDSKGHAVGRIAARSAVASNAYQSPPEKRIDLAVSWRRVALRSERVGRHPLHQCPRLDKAFFEVRHSGTCGPAEIRPTTRLRQGGGYRSHQGRRSTAQGSWASFHHLVTTQIAGVPAPATRSRGNHTINHSSQTSSGR